MPGAGSGSDGTVDSSPFYAVDQEKLGYTDSREKQSVSDCRQAGGKEVAGVAAKEMWMRGCAIRDG